MSEIKLLQVGDFVYGRDRWHGIQRCKIAKVTPKQAFTEGGTKLKREILNGAASVIGEYGSLEIETPELLAKWRLKYKIKKAQNAIRLLQEMEVTEELADKVIAFYETIKPTVAP
jgi:hypothetical protein